MVLAILVLLSGCGARSAGLPADGPSLPSVAGAASTPVEVGADRVELFTDGAPLVERLLQLIDAASHSIDAEIYEFDRAEVVSALLRARARGVRIEVISDPTVRNNQRSLDQLRQAAIDVLLYPDADKQIDHVKLLMVDGRVAIFGGMNWGARSYRNHDFDLEVQGPAVDRLEGVFVNDLAHCGRLVASGSGVMGDAPAPLRILVTQPERDIGPAIGREIDSARTSLFIEMFVLTDSRTIRRLGAAARRGVNVFVLLDPEQGQNVSALVRLRNVGVHARFFRSIAGEKLHAKAMVIDSTRLLVGSANWSVSGFTRNHELDADIDNAPIARQALARMESDWNRAAGYAEA